MKLFKRGATAVASPAMALVVVIAMICLAADASNRITPRRPSVFSKLWAKWMDIHFGFQFFIVLIGGTVLAGLLFGKW